MAMNQPPLPDRHNFRTPRVPSQLVQKHVKRHVANAATPETDISSCTTPACSARSHQSGFSSSSELSSARTWTSRTSLAPELEDQQSVPSTTRLEDDSDARAVLTASKGVQMTSFECLPGSEQERTVRSLLNGWDPACAKKDASKRDPTDGGRAKDSSADKRRKTKFRLPWKSKKDASRRGLEAEERQAEVEYLRLAARHATTAVLELVDSLQHEMPTTRC